MTPEDGHHAPGADIAHRIDAHLHLWDLEHSDYRWITPELGPLYASFGPADVAPAIADAGVHTAVLVQAEDTSRDTDFMLDLADRVDWIGGVVGWVPLEDPAAAEAHLDRRAAEPAFKGVRHLVHDDPREDFLDQPAVRAALASLSGRGLPFDVPDAWPRHLHQVSALAAALPELVVVVDHLAKPPTGPGEEAAFEAWRAELARTAACQNTVAKVSGLRRPGAVYSADALRRAWESALDLFGPERLMWGSDWPMNVPDGGYAPTLAVLEELIGELSPDEQHAIWSRTATRVYRLS